MYRGWSPCRFKALAHAPTHLILNPRWRKQAERNPFDLFLLGLKWLAIYLLQPRQRTCSVRAGSYSRESRQSCVLWSHRSIPMHPWYQEMDDCCSSCVLPRTTKDVLSLWEAEWLHPMRETATEQLARIGSDVHGTREELIAHDEPEEETSDGRCSDDPSIMNFSPRHSVGGGPSEIRSTVHHVRRDVVQSQSGLSCRAVRTRWGSGLQNIAVGLAHSIPSMIRYPQWPWHSPTRFKYEANRTLSLFLPRKLSLGWDAHYHWELTRHSTDDMSLSGPLVLGLPLQTDLWPHGISVLGSYVHCLLSP